MVAYLDWFHPVVYADGGYILADKFLFAVPEGGAARVAGLLEQQKLAPLLLLCGCLVLRYPNYGPQAHLLIKHDFPVPTSPMEMTLMRTTLLRAVHGSPPILLLWDGAVPPEWWLSSCYS